MTPLERAAQALGAIHIEIDGGSCQLNGLLDDDEIRASVRAVLTAIREPSEGVKAAGQKHHWGCDYPESSDQEEAENCGAIFTAMIDALLAEGE